MGEEEAEGEDGAKWEERMMMVMACLEMRWRWVIIHNFYTKQSSYNISSVLIVVEIEENFNIVISRPRKNKNN